MLSQENIRVLGYFVVLSTSSFEDGERRSTLTYSIRNEELTPNTIEQHTVIMDVMNPQQARVAEEAGAVAVVRTLSLLSLS